MKRQQGFTLIELIVVIVILGILAATALPKFADLSADARAAKVNGALGAMKSAASIAHAAWLASGSSAANTVALEGQDISMASGYPAATVTGIALAAGLTNSAGTLSTDWSNTGTPLPSGAYGYVIADPNSKTNCAVGYSAATSTSGPKYSDPALPGNC